MNEAKRKKMVRKSKSPGLYDLLSPNATGSTDWSNMRLSTIKVIDKLEYKKRHYILALVLHP